MASDVVVPEVGETGMDVTFVRWCKAAGDQVAVGDVLFELDTDKAVVEVEAWAVGTLVDLRVTEGDVVAPRQVVARILAPDEAEVAPDEAGQGAPAGVPASGRAVAAASFDAVAAASGGAVAERPGIADRDLTRVPEPAGPPSSGDSPAPGTPSDPAAPRAGPTGLLSASPRARRLARERGIDLATIAGSGPDGLITERDVMATSGNAEASGEAAGH